MYNKHKYKEEQVEAHNLVKNLGGNEYIAKKIGTSAAAISWWRKNGVPELRMIQLENVFGKEVVEKAKQDSEEYAAV